MPLLIMEEKDKIYWKSFEELAKDPRTLELAQREFMQEDDGSDFLSLSRRKFLKLLGASVALATTSCRRPVAKILPYVKQAENVKPGIAQYYASTFALNHHSYGILVKTIEGRPIKIEGNPDHPLSQGSAGTWAQASVLELYDPDRKRNPTIGDHVVSWDEWDKEIISLLQKSKNIRFLTESNSSPTFKYTLKKLLKVLPNSHWNPYEPVSQERARLAFKKAFGRPDLPKLHLDKAKIILSINSDFLCSDADSLIHIKNWAKGRKIRSSKDTLNRLYVLESFFSTTGSNADHRLSVKPSQLLSFALELAQILVTRFHLSTDPSHLSLLNTIPDHSEKTVEREFLLALAEDLAQHHGQSVVVVGQQESVELQVVGQFINSLIGSFGPRVGGSTLDSKVSVASFDNGHESLKPLLSELKAGKVDTLITLGGNPVYQLGAEFEALMKKVPNTIRLSLYSDETTAVSKYAAPLSHFLESWGDSRPEDGLVSLIQPTIQPLHNSRSSGEVMISWLYKMSGKASHPTEDWLSEIKLYWKKNIYAKKNTFGSFETFWEGALQDGVVTETLPLSKAFHFNSSALSEAISNFKKTPSDTLELQWTPSPALFDGRFANGGSLQELPDPVTKVTWDNVASMSAKTALKYGLKQGNKIKLSGGASTVTLPVFLQPGLAEDVITTSIGYGRRAGGEIGMGVGSNVFVLGQAWQYKNVQLKKHSGQHKIATTQTHHSMEGRPIVLEATLEEYKKHPDFPKHKIHTPELLSLYQDYPYTGHKWGMAIDLNSCVGCSGCVVACDVENNIPNVGKAQVLKGREMQWLRLDRYYETSSENEVKTLHQPMLCQHCDNAPCETVCPVSATVHSDEGINQMTYNRCVGTRYCANNCPYKVRRFNYFNFNADIETPQELGKNPSVTIRSRGVMEKCTFCIQRISEGKNAAKMRGEKVSDGEIQTACQQACPSQAIVFGDLNDPNSEVSKLSSLSQGYRVLEELNVRPAVTYLAKIRNPHPRLEKRVS
ncbi:MAG: TAT-variant-translocated molybdopterin oxidoreductase [Deltaproteobacteria bacterium]|nr:TAT-variant-translocated molybdopterin oxidoreductase [Deltaproteobacteria bacterium]